MEDLKNISFIEMLYRAKKFKEIFKDEEGVHYRVQEDIFEIWDNENARIPKWVPCEYGVRSLNCESYTISTAPADSSSTLNCMIKITTDQAVALWEEGSSPVYRLYDDGSEVLIDEIIFSKDMGLEFKDLETYGIKGMLFNDYRTEGK